MNSDSNNADEQQPQQPQQPQQKLNIDEQNNEGETALHIAVKENMVPIVDLLIQHNANPNIKTNDDKGGNTPLHLALSKNPINKELIEHLMLSNLVDPQITNAEGISILEMAEETGDQDIINMFKPSEFVSNS